MMVSLMLLTLTVNAQSGFGLMGGVNSSTSSANDVGWRTGGFIGGLYDIQLNNWFYLQPRLVLSYQENQREVKNTLSTPSKSLGNEFYSQWNVTIPLLASFRMSLSDKSALRLNVGPYIQYAIFGREKNVYYYNAGQTIQSYGETSQVPAGVSDLKWWHYDFGDKITYGGQVGLQFEHKKFFGTLDYKHSFHRNQLNMNGFENTLQLGIGYKF